MVKTGTGLLLLLFPFFPRVFCCCGCFVSDKTSVVFFAYCCSLPFWLCLFARGRAFLAVTMLLCLCLWLANTKKWFSPFPVVFFLLTLIFFTTLKVVFCSCRFVVVFLAVLFRSCCYFFLLFILFVLLLKLKNILFGYCVFLLRYGCCFCYLFGPVFGVAFFSWCPSVVMRVKQCPPFALPCPASPTFRFPPFHNTHMYPSNPCVRTCTLFALTHMVMSVLVFVLVFVCLVLALCARVCLCLRLLVRLLVCLHLCFAFFLCVCGCPVCLSMCLHMYFVFVSVCLYVCILPKIRVFLYHTCLD